MVIPVSLSYDGLVAKVTQLRGDLQQKQRQVTANECLATQRGGNYSFK